uniref:HNH nuclease domain-containing protein n=1 Tax=Chromera velia CCMP2878 TaxID=1169474 RepID=A0A0G4HMR4_9ALVE|eukprot:Cvel_29388.t1-p1 / transcript=Cvel_29388.t1 / gene=Cvel_29388 / organism=Chromera_velia_CCMP2878 / gene_product=Uncharacterized protein L246, putative / transcript_product=Uncharacterized protein L246, putative / location=Cvel_scaffold4007:8376-10456(+) / protein_length=424 / sequence_SO=supercontig / SO=protein_coding / is_pseudo=false
MEGMNICVESAEAEESVNTVGSVAGAENVVEGQSVNMGADVSSAQRVGEVQCVNMAGRDTTAKSAAAKEYASTDATVRSAKSVGGMQYVRTVVVGLNVESAEGEEFVNTDAFVQNARIVGGAAFVNTGASEPAVLTARKTTLALRDGKSPSQKKRTHEYLGCSFPDLIAHLEKDDFHGNPGMSWENYGSLWHVDHIVPIQYRGADGQKPDVGTVISRLHYSNLQPMWGKDNLRKDLRHQDPRVGLSLPQQMVEKGNQAVGAAVGGVGTVQQPTVAVGERGREDLRQRQNDARKVRYREDPVFRLTHSTRTVVRKCLSSIRKGQPPSLHRKHTHEYLGCSFPDLIAHLEKDNFHGNPGMSWENYGSLWHVDHIVPIQYRGADGQKPDVATQIARLHFSNLQPLPARENLRKGNRFVGRLSRLISS